ncbi:phage tail protein [Pseudomonas syringae]|uniref:phage tail protein n=1 Tax=Pseudomonas syringae TaxID=317 RepID=UPI001F2C0CA2|nr:phage tail protein [Pseudomonas syringae]MCF5708333.1 phage tail protein [Pseudomonas syringae]
MNTVFSARNPGWADQAHTTLNLWVIFEENKDSGREQGISLSANDPDPQVVALLNRAISGEFGEIAEPTEQMVRMTVMIQRGGYSADASKKIDLLANELSNVQNAVASGAATQAQIDAMPALQAELDAYMAYRADLAHLEDIPGFPMSFVWPVPPASPFVYVKPPEVPTPPTGVSEDELPWVMTSIRNPRWADQTHNAIVLLVVFEKTKDTRGEEAITVSFNDPRPQARKLFDRAAFSEFGPVLEPLEPAVPVDGRVQRDRYAAAATAKIDALNNTLSTLQSAIEAQLKSLPALQAERDAYWLYRVQLAQLDALPGFPLSFEWPVAPATPFA